jgi:hypothetical protein
MHTVVFMTGSHRDDEHVVNVISVVKHEDTLSVIPVTTMTVACKTKHKLQ